MGILHKPYEQVSLFANKKKDNADVLYKESLD